MNSLVLDDLPVPVIHWGSHFQISKLMENMFLLHLHVHPIPHCLHHDLAEGDATHQLVGQLHHVPTLLDWFIFIHIVLSIPINCHIDWIISFYSPNTVLE